MKLSSRLKMVASLVSTGNNVIDVGCDHALLDIYLTLNNNNKCIASDINKNALSGAIKNIKNYNLDKEIKTILSDGLENINIPDKSSVIISGMGTMTILDIIKNANHENIDELIIQSNNDLELLRRKIIKFGYYIEDEDVILDKKIYYVIIKFKKGHRSYNKKDYILGPILKTKNYIDRINYYDSLNKKNNFILKKIPFKYFGSRYKLKKIRKWLTEK